jgi:hypothetical protein
MMHPLTMLLGFGCPGSLRAMFETKDAYVAIEGIVTDAQKPCGRFRKD